MKNRDWQKEIKRITDFIRRQVSQAGFSNVVVGLSGGLDSSVTAALAVRALDAEHVYALILPYKTSAPQNVADAEQLADELKINKRTIDISPMVDAYFDNYEPEADILRRGNRMARERMCILYDHSAKYKALVIGTGNRSELLAGYCTQYGDSACAFEPIGHLYKTEIKELAKYIDLPEHIIHKVPSADLWIDQTDEGELGLSYEELDNIYYQYFELGKQNSQIEGVSEEKIKRALDLYEGSFFKRNLPPILPINDNKE
jgi:NAD+ synthase